MAALKASLEAAKGGCALSDGDGELTLEQLREHARDAGIAGRSNMTKDELRQALKAA